MKKSIYLCLIAFFAVKSVTFAKDIPPFIDAQGYIQLASNWGLCGSLVIKPLEQPSLSNQNLSSRKIILRAFLLGNDTQVNKEVGFVTLEKEGIKSAYRWGMIFRPSSFYRITCFIEGTTSTGSPVSQQVPCGDVVSLEQIIHNVPCVVGKQGPGGSFDPLGMK